jgi:hypothetical protein
MHLSCSAKQCRRYNQGGFHNRIQSIRPANHYPYRNTLWHSLEDGFVGYLFNWSYPRGTVTESNSASLGLRGFETCRLFLSEHALTSTHGWFSQRSIWLVLAKWLPQQSRNLCPLQSVQNLLTTFLRCIDSRGSILTRPSHCAGISFTW